jgi:O-antigen/teichoic acid export membrane protein
MHRFDVISILSSIATMLLIAGTVCVLTLGGGLIGLALVNIFVPLAMQIPAIRAIRHLAPELSYSTWRGHRSALRSLVQFGSSIFLIHTAGQLQTETDGIVIATNLPVRAVTPYALAQRLSTIPQALTDQFLQILLPLVSELDATRDTARLRALYLTATRLTLAIFLPIGCSIVVFARPLLGLWVGPQYAAYADLVVILTFASLLDTSQWPASFVLQGTNRHRPAAIGALCSGAANLALSILLVQRFGIRGVAIGTLIPTAIECLGFLLPYTLHVTGVTFVEVLTRAIIPGVLPVLPMVILFVLMQLTVKPVSLASLIPVIAVGFALYLLAYLGVGASEEERDLYRRSVRNILLAAKGRTGRS